MEKIIFSEPVNTISYINIKETDVVIAISGEENVWMLKRFNNKYYWCFIENISDRKIDNNNNMYNSIVEALVIFRYVEYSLLRFNDLEEMIKFLAKKWTVKNE